MRARACVCGRGQVCELKRVTFNAQRATRKISAESRLGSVLLPWLGPTSLHSAVDARVSQDAAFKASMNGAEARPALFE